MHKFKKLILKIVAGVATILIVLHDFSKPVFARMGSTGGGSSSGGGGSISSGGSVGSSFDSGSNSTDDSAVRLTHLGVFDYNANGFNFTLLLLNIIIALAFGVIAFFVLRARHSFDTKKTLLLASVFCAIIMFLMPVVSIICLIGMTVGSDDDSDDDTAELNQFRYSLIDDVPKTFDNLYNLLLTQNMPIAFFERILDKFEIKLDSVKLIDNDQLIEIYKQAEYTYGHVIREFITGNKNTKMLKQYLANPFYNTMLKEIQLKAEQQTMDDVVVNKAVISKSVKINNLVIAKVDAIGSDSENQVNSNFDSSFKQEKWTDYVIYKQFGQSYKIVNIVYGEHFHLNGEDFNNQTGLSDSGYTENDLRDHEHDMFK